METTFISILDLSQSANVLYTSDSIIDILGYSPDDVLYKSAWDFFHPDELPLARAKHDRSIQMDNASVLSYCRMRDKYGRWIGCEVVFTVVYDVVVGCISIYRRGLKSQNRAMEAPAVRRLFSTSPRDPRYHMMSHLSSKFQQSASALHTHERRTALFLNRYTRTLTIMYATDGLADLLGISGEELIGKSFYYCIQENCLKDAVRCLENAKANDSIAYLRFWYRDPRTDDDTPANGQNGHHTDSHGEDSLMTDAPTSSEDDMDVDGRGFLGHHGSSNGSVASEPLSSSDSIEPAQRTNSHNHFGGIDSRTSSDESNQQFSHEAVFGDPQQRNSSASSMSTGPGYSNGHQTNGYARPREPIELEAVVSCTSDGLVVCLRRAAPFVPQQTAQRPVRSAAQSGYTNGLFAVPWASEPIIPPHQQRSQQPNNTGFAPSLTPAQAYHRPLAPSSRPPQNDFMSTIRECAVFAWAIVGINGSLATYGRGTPRGESQPSSGLPVWQPDDAEQRAQQRQLSNGSNGSSAGRPYNYSLAESSPSSIATGPYFGAPDLCIEQQKELNQQLQRSPQRQRQRFGELQPEGPPIKAEKDYDARWEHSPKSQSRSDDEVKKGRTAGSSPAAPSHMVDGVADVFDNQRDPFSPQRGFSARSQQQPSNFGSADPGLNAHYSSKSINKPFQSTPQQNGNAQYSTRPSRTYYDPARPG